MFTRNPILNEKSFYADVSERKETFSIHATLNKSLLLLAFTFVVALATWRWQLHLSQHASTILGVSALAALVLGIIIRYKKPWAAPLSFLYAACKGIFLGVLSAQFEAKWSGIVVQAIFLCLLVFICMLLLYRFRIIKVNQELRAVIYTATMAIIIIYAISFLSYYFNLPQIPYIHESGIIGILFSVFVVGTASFHLLLDFDFIERASNKKYLPYFEWYAAFGLLVSVLWQYVSMLKLLKKLKQYK